MRQIALTFFFLFTFSNSFSQNDCVDAIIVCGNSSFGNLSANGIGNTQELSRANTCSSQENNSLWLSINIKTGGTLGFTLTPVFPNSGGTSNPDIDIDFDFFIFGPNVNCGAIGQSIRCSTTNPSIAGLTNNLTGMNSTEVDTSEGPGSFGNSFVSSLNVNAGDSYFLVIDRPIGASNFKIDWTGTATFSDPPTNQIPVGTTINLEECDADGILDNKTLFDLTVNTPILLGTQTGVSVTYYTSNNDAQTNTNEIKNPSAFQNTVDPQTIHARLTDDSSGCFSVKTFQIDVLDQLNLGVPITNKVCDDNNDGLSSFNLTQNNITIQNGLPNTTVSYYTSESDANGNSTSGINPITNPTTFINTLGNPQTIWARLDNNSSSCFGVTSFNIQTFNSPMPTQPNNYHLCDTGNDGVETYNFNTQITPQLGIDTTLFTVTYHTTPTRDVNDQIASPGTYQNVTTNDTIYIKIENQQNTDCRNTNLSFQVFLDTIPVPQTPLTQHLCDDIASGNNTDGISSFRLNTKDIEVLGTLDSNQYIVSYHKTLADAQTSSTTNPIDKTTDFTVTNTQRIYVRVENKDNPNCNAISDDIVGSTFRSFELIVEPLPIPKENPTELKQCDSDSDKQTTFNLTLVESKISDNPKDTFQYFATEMNANTGSPEITDKTSYFVDTTGEAWVRIISEFGCYTISKINLFVSYTPKEPYENTFISCDDFLDIDGNNTSANSDTDGITNFDFSIAPNQISKDPDIRVEFYETQDDRTKSINKIQDTQNISQYRNKNIPNTTANRFPIFYKLVSKTNNDCFGLGQIYLQIKPLPSFTVMGEENIDDPQIICLNNKPLTLEAENLGAFYNYTWTNEAGTVLGNTSTLNVTSGGKYSVTATNQSIGGCSRKRTIVVKESNVATLKDSFITIIDESNNIRNQENISISINTKDNNLGPGNYQFAIRNDDTNNTTPFQDEPLFENLIGGIYTIIVNDKNGCVPDTELQISVIQFPKFFTPNGDGKNDTWVIKGANKTFYPSANINIFNRFGKLVAQIPIDSEGWNGIYNGKVLSSNDYWYDVQLIPADKSKPPILKKGHFSLLRK